MLKMILLEYILILISIRSLYIDPVNMIIVNAEIIGITLSSLMIIDIKNVITEEK